MAKSYINKKIDGKIVPKSRPDIPGEDSGKGLRYCRCVVCLEIFSSPGTYELHRKPAGRMDNYHRICLDPESVGLILGERNVWVIADRDDNEAP